MEKEQQGKATIRDVARLAEVSVSSVSRYLADPSSVRAYAAYRIREAIQRLGYEPNAFARGLRQGHGQTVGMVVPNLEFFFAKACRAASDYFYEQGYAVFVCPSDGAPAKEQFFVRRLLGQRVAGLIVSSCGLNPVFLQQQARQGPPLVLLGGAEPVACDLVAVDYARAARRLVARLLAQDAPTELHLLLGEQAAASTRLCEEEVRRALPPGAGLPVIPHYGCWQEGRMPATVDQAVEAARTGRPAVLAFEPEFLEQTAILLNRRDTRLLDRVVLTGLAMPNLCDKLGLWLPCLTLDAACAGVTAAQALHRRIGAREPAEPPRAWPVPARPNWDAGDEATTRAEDRPS